VVVGGIMGGVGVSLNNGFLVLVGVGMMVLVRVEITVAVGVTCGELCMGVG
jgi:opacity protein-like surface antigen